MNKIKKGIPRLLTLNKHGMPFYDTDDFNWKKSPSEVVLTILQMDFYSLYILYYMIDFEMSIGKEKFF